MILFGSVLSLFFSLLLLTKRNKSRADFILFFWMFLISIHLLLFHISNNDLYKKFPHVIGIDIAFPIFHALFLFFYVRTLTGKGFNRTDFLHLLPSACAYLYMIPFFAKPASDKYIYFQNIFDNEKYFLALFNIVFLLSAITYTILTFSMIRKYREFLGQHYSFSDRVNLLWMKRLLTGMIIIWIVVMVIKFNEMLNFTQFQIRGNYIISISASLFVVFLGFFGIRQTAIFSDHSNINENTVQIKAASIKERYQKSGLKDEQIVAVKEKLSVLMQVEKRYLDNKLSLDQLSEEIEINPNYLSQVINEHYSKNFYDFVNSYRIEEFKTKSQDPRYKKYSILALALECGFNSKSAFYNVFRKQVGMSPSEFLKNISQQ